MILNRLLCNKDLALYCSVTKMPITLASIMIGYGYGSKEIDRGYAHLFEHMVIKSNQKYFNSLEEKGINYNAETQKDKILFTFIGFNGDILENEILNLRKIFDTEFRSDDLETEKKTIIQEYLYRSKAFTKESIEAAIGSIENIKAFSIEKLNDVKDKILVKSDIMYITGHPEKITDKFRELENLNLNENWYENVIIQDIYESDDGIFLELSENVYAEMFIHNLNILCMCSFKKENIEVHRYDNKCFVKLMFSGERLIDILKEKHNSFSRYILFLDTIKVYYQELANFISDIGVNYDLEKCYYSQWEVKLFEKSS